MQTDQVTMHVVRRASPDECVVVCSLLRVPHDADKKETDLIFPLPVDGVSALLGMFSNAARVD